MDVECKGLIFRAYNSVFKRRNGHYEQQQGFRLAKRLSCKGCSNCGGLLDYANEALCDGAWLHDKHLDNGAYYRLTCDHDGEFKFKALK